MNSTAILWLLLAAFVMIGGREIYLALRIWWITSKGGDLEYSFKLYVIHYRIASQTRIYIWRLRIGSLWQKVRVWWWMRKINSGYNADYPSYTPPPSPHRKYLDKEGKRYASPYQEIKVSTDSRDIRSEALKAVALKPDAIVILTEPTSGALLVKELNSTSKTKYQYVFDADIQTGAADYTKVLVDMNVLNGSILYTVPNVYRKEFDDAFKKEYGAEPAIGSETGYDAFMLLAQTYNVDKAQWVDAMKHASFTGADGKIVFDENGVRIPELKIGTIEGGKLPN